MLTHTVYRKAKHSVTNDIHKSLRSAKLEITSALGQSISAKRRLSYRLSYQSIVIRPAIKNRGSRKRLS